MMRTTVGVLLACFMVLTAETEDGRERLARPIRPPTRISSFSEEYCRAHFRFSRCHLEELLRILEVPATFELPNGAIVAGEEALLIFLRRMSYPNRLLTLEYELGVDYTIISRIVSTFLEWFYAGFHHLVEEAIEFWQPMFDACAAAVGAHIGVEDCSLMGFIDGTVRAICRPTGDPSNQRSVYSGHKRLHALKYQGVVLPNGMIADMYGPAVGRRHDMHLLVASRINERLAAAQATIGRQRYIYGDAAYPVLSHVMGARRRMDVDPVLNAVDRQLSGARIAVEWAFGKVISEFAFLDFEKNQKLFLSPVSKLYIVACVLTNLHTCFYGNQISMMYNYNPPSAAAYVGLFK